MEEIRSRPTPRTSDASSPTLDASSSAQCLYAPLIRSLQAHGPSSTSSNAEHSSLPSVPEPESSPSVDLDTYSSGLLLNVQSLNPSARSACSWKLPYLTEMELKKRTASNCVPFIALTETWLKSYVQDAQLHVDGYNILRCDRDTRVGGGVMLYTHQDLAITQTETFDNDHCQLLLCTSDPSKVIISLLYRPPNAPHASFQACLDKVRQYLVGHDDYDVCFLGDYNFPYIQWGPVTTTFSTESSSALLDFMSEHLLSQYVLQPTRKDKVLDLFITNSPSLVTHVSTSDTKLSDHRLVEIFLSYNLCQPNIASPPSFETNSFRSLDFTKGDFVKINNRLSTVNWAELSSTCDEEEFPERVTQVLLEACQEGCPLKVPPRAKKGSRLLHTLSLGKNANCNQLLMQS